MFYSRLSIGIAIVNIVLNEFFDPNHDSDPTDRPQNLADCSLGHAPSIPKISSKYVRDVLRYFAHRNTDGDTHRHSHGQTHRQLRKHHPQAGRNYMDCRFWQFFSATDDMTRQRSIISHAVIWTKCSLIERNSQSTSRFL